MKKILLIIVTLAVLLSCTGCSKKKEEVVNPGIGEGKYPIKWDDTLIFKDEAQMEEDYQALMKWPEDIKQYQGKLNTVDGLYGYISTLYDYDYNALYDKFNAYATYGTNVYPLEEKYKTCAKKLADFEDVMEEARLFFDSEMATIPYETRIELFTDDKLIDYLADYFYYLSEDLTQSNDDVLTVFNTATLSHGRMSKLQNILVNFSIPDVEYKLSNKETLKLNEGNIVSTLSKDYDEKTKEEIFDAYWGNVANYADALTYILETQMLEQYSNAQLIGYYSTRDMAIYEMGFYDDIIQKIIDYAHENSSTHAKYYSLYADKDGTYHTYSKYTPLSNYKVDYIKYDDGVDDVVNALSILGDEYKNNLLKILNSGHVDVYPTDNKKTGAFEIGNFADQDPFVMFNYDGTTEDVADIAHEMGHACYDKLANANQDIRYWGTAIFTQEVASVTNELIYYEYKIKNAQSEDEKAYYMEMYLNRWSTDMFNGCIYQEFENYCHDLVDAGESLNSNDLYNKWEELSKIYYGNDIDQGEYGSYKWATLSSLYDNYYQYTYATSVCYATVLSKRIVNGDSEALNNYLEFLKAGGSVASVDALAIAGIDIYDNSVYDEAFAYFSEMVDNLANLYKK